MGSRCTCWIAETVFFINNCRAANFGPKTGFRFILAPFGKDDAFLGKSDKSSGCLE